MHRVYITVVGSSSPQSAKELEVAERVGELIAARGAVLVCGGRGGVMEAAARGAKRAGGVVVGILPGKSRDEANPYVDIAIPTGMSHARNAINVLAGDAVIVVGGGPGTLSEVGLALAYGKPVIAIRGSGGIADLVAGAKIGRAEVVAANTAEEAVETALRLVTGARG